MRWRALMSVLLLALLVPAAAATAPLPADLAGELNGVPYRIRVPANWNGTLLVYNYGYAEAYASPPLAPMASPTLPGPDEQALLGRGFALAVCRAPGRVMMLGMGEAGWNMKERMQCTVALTAAFRDIVGRPQRTILWGKSFGALLALALIEKYPGLYDGAIALSAPAAGAPRRQDQGLDVTLAYAVAFDDWDASWGTPGDLRDDLNYVNEVMPHIQSRITPANRPLWEFVRLINRAPVEAYYTDAIGNPSPMPRLTAMYFAIGVRAELENRASGAVAQNAGRVYTLSDDEKAYLAGLGVDANVLLAEMNEQTNFRSDPNARNYAEHYVNPTGRITRPVLTLHTKGDILATPNHESAYKDTVDNAKCSGLLMQGHTSGLLHAVFTVDQEMAAVDAMMHWLDTAEKPDPAVYFPETLGFEPAYVPGEWPW